MFTTLSSLLDLNRTKQKKLIGSNKKKNKEKGGTADIQIAFSNISNTLERGKTIEFSLSKFSLI